jgi:hypothetical protein
MRDEGNGTQRRGLQNEEPQKKRRRPAAEHLFPSLECRKRQHILSENSLASDSLEALSHGRIIWKQILNELIFMYLRIWSNDCTEYSDDITRK